MIVDASSWGVLPAWTFVAWLYVVVFLVLRASRRPGALRSWPRVAACVGLLAVTVDSTGVVL